MNELVVKRAVIFSLILGAFLGLISLIPSVIGLGVFIMSFFASVIVIFYMKQNEKYLGIIDTQQGAILGSIIGFFTGVGFFASFCPMVMLISLVIKNYYTYTIPYVIHDAIWLFFIIVFMVSATTALFNSVGGMAMALIFSRLEKKPEDYDARLDIKIDD